MKTTKTYATVLALVCLGTCAGPARPDERAPDPAQWAPADALIYVGIQDIDQYWSDFQKTTGYRAMLDEELVKSPAMGGPFEFGTVMTEAKKRLAKMLNIDPAELKNPLAGPATFYLTTPPGAGLDDVQVAVVAGVGDTAVLQRYLDALTPRLKDAATKYETTSAGRYTVHAFTTSKSKTRESLEDDEFEFGPGPGLFGDVPDLDRMLDRLLSFEELPAELAYCLADKRLLVANSAEHLKAVLAGARGRTLADTDDYKLLTKHFTPLGQGRFLLNMPRLFAAARADQAEEESVRELMSILGAGSMRSVIGHWHVGTQSYDHKSELLILSSGQRSGVFKILSMENRPVEPPSWISTDAAVFFSLNLSPPKLLDEILAIMAQNAPEMGQEVSGMLEGGPPGPDGQPMSWRRALIDHLTEPLTGAIGFARPYGGGSLRYLLTLDHRNREALTRIMGVLTGGSPPRDVGGTPVYTEPNSGASIAVTANRMMLGNRPAVEAGLSPTPGAGLAQDSNFRRAKRHVPDEAWCVVYVDSRKFMEGLIGLAEKQDELLDDSLTMSLMFMLRMSGVDLSDTTRNQKLLQYCTPVIVAVATVPDGLRFTYVDLRQSEE